MMLGEAGRVILEFCDVQREAVEWKENFSLKKNKTYMDKLMTEKDFREKFDQEYQNLCEKGSKRNSPNKVDIFLTQEM